MTQPLKVYLTPLSPAEASWLCLRIASHLTDRKIDFEFKHESQWSPDDAEARHFLESLPESYLIIFNSDVPLSVIETAFDEIAGDWGYRFQMIESLVDGDDIRRLAITQY